VGSGLLKRAGMGLRIAESETDDGIVFPLEDSCSGPGFLLAVKAAKELSSGGGGIAAGDGT
jgi:hypothetical protein